MLISQEVLREVRRRGNPKFGSTDKRAQPGTTPTEVKSNNTSSKSTEKDTAEASEGHRDQRIHVENAFSPVELERAVPQLLHAESDTQIIGVRSPPQLSAKDSEHDAKVNSSGQSAPRCNILEGNTIESDHQATGTGKIPQNKYDFR